MLYADIEAKLTPATVLSPIIPQMGQSVNRTTAMYNPQSTEGM